MSRFIPTPKEVGKGQGPLDHANDRKVWTINEFGLRIYAAKGYVIAIEARVNGRWQEVHVDPGVREFRPFIEAMKQAREVAQGRRSTETLR